DTFSLQNWQTFLFGLRITALAIVVLRVLSPARSGYRRRNGGLVAWSGLFSCAGSRPAGVPSGDSEGRVLRGAPGVAALAALAAHAATLRLAAEAAMRRSGLLPPPVAAALAALAAALRGR